MNSSIAKLLRSTWSGLPTVLTLIAICFVAIIGHHNNWKMPSLAKVFGQQDPPADDWCGEHGVPESTCIKCNGTAVDASVLPSKDESPKAHAEHGDHDHDHDHNDEAKSATTTPAAVDWCAEHGVPESICTKCNPTLIPGFKAKGDWCNGHGLPESQCIQCNPELKEKFEQMAPKAAAENDSIVQLSSTEIANEAGIQTQKAESLAISNVLEFNAEVRYDMKRYAQVSPRATGNVSVVRINTGESVKRGDVLALVDSADVGKAKAEYLVASALVAAKQASLERLKAGVGEGFRNKSDLINEEAELREITIRAFNARQSLAALGFVIPDLKADQVPSEHDLQLLGLPESVRQDLKPGQASANLIPVVAPFDGVVISQSIVEGEMIELGKPMFVVADVSRMWVMLDIPTSDLAHIKVGQEILFSADALITPKAGKITWISTNVDEHSRTIQARAEVPNEDGRLLANLFGRAKVSIASESQAVIVPNSAVQRDGEASVVFVKMNDEVYVARTVTLGEQSGDKVGVVGIRSDEAVAVSGSYSLLAQLNRAKLGAGCADH